MQKLHREIHQTATVKCWRTTAMEDKPVCFAIRAGVVKGDHSTAMLRGSKNPLGRRMDQSSVAKSQPASAFGYTLIHVCVSTKYRCV